MAYEICLLDLSARFLIVNSEKQETQETDHQLPGRNHPLPEESNL